MLFQKLKEKLLRMGRENVKTIIVDSLSRGHKKYNLKSHKAKTRTLSRKLSENYEKDYRKQWVKNINV